MKERNVMQLLPYLSMGWAVINVEYRLANNSPAPAAVEQQRIPREQFCGDRGVSAQQWNPDKE